jgi:hypothetical protein
MKDLIIAILGITLVSVLLIRKPVVKENFWGLPNRTVYKDEEYKIQNKCGSVMYSVPPTYQAMLSPRFSNVNYGANIRYDTPESTFLGSPDHPLGCAGPGVNSIIKENYYQPSSNGSMKETLSNCAAINKFMKNAEMGQIAMSPPEGITVSNSGCVMPSQVVNYDRLIFANQRSRLYGLGDPIRGDLPIVPIRSDWFRPSVHPNIDLRQGAMNIIGGDNNATANALAQLQDQSSGRADIAQKDISLGAAQGDIIVTAFP